MNNTTFTATESRIIDLKEQGLSHRVIAARVFGGEGKYDMKRVDNALQRARKKGYRGRCGKCGAPR